MRQIRGQWEVLIIGVLCLYIGLGILINYSFKGMSYGQDVGGSILCVVGVVLITIGIQEKGKKE